MRLLSLKEWAELLLRRVVRLVEHSLCFGDGMARFENFVRPVHLLGFDLYR
jgi:hypothetical protein